MKAARPFQVSTFGLSPDMKRVDPGFGRIKRGDVSRRRLAEVLEIYRKLDTEWGPSVSHIAVHSATGQFVVRVVSKQLTLGVDGEPTAKAVPLAAAEVVARLERPPELVAVDTTPPPPEPRWRIAIALGFLVAGVALTVYALRPVLTREAVRPGEHIAIITGGPELQAQQRALVGMFATGRQQGDRNLTISGQGYVVFAELGSRGGLVSGGDNFQIGRRESRLCLVTPRNGVIEVIDANTLRYYGDTYRRLD